MEVESTISDTLATEVPKLLKNVAQVSFSWYDYLLFSAMLGLSALIGIYFGCFGTKQSSADEYLMGNKKMKVFPIAVSLIASHVSGITLLAVPADIYRYGATYWLFILSLCIVAPLTIYVYLPVFFKLQLTSTYEYLERRFDNTNRLFASFLFTLGLFFYLPVVIYIPALALSAATGISVHYITPIVCGVCIFYTTLGGLKAVVWTDTLQFTVTTGAVFIVAIIGVQSGGGFAEIWKTALEGHRLDVFNFDPDPTLRDSFWIATIGISIYWLSIVGIHQSCVQKFLSVSTYAEAKLAVIYFSVGVSVISSCSVFMGLIMYAKYANCDPFTLGTVKKNDQLLPYYVMDVASHVPGLSGLFIAGIFCAGLSTLSASLNCMAGTIFEDFVIKFTGPIKDDKKTAYILKLIVVLSGVLCTVLVYVVEHLGGILPLVLSLGGVTFGPSLGMFTLGLLFPRASSKGCYYGAIIGLLFAGWIAVMAQYYKGQGMLVDVPKPVSTEGCFVQNATTYFEEFTTVPTVNFSTDSTVLPVFEELHSGESKPFVLFRVSFYYYAPIGTIVTLIFGLLISYTMQNDDPPVHRDLISPVVYFLLPEEKPQDQTNADYYGLDKALQLVSVNSEKEDDEKV